MYCTKFSTITNHSNMALLKGTLMPAHSQCVGSTPKSNIETCSKVNWHCLKFNLIIQRNLLKIKKVFS